MNLPNRDNRTFSGFLATTLLLGVSLASGKVVTVSLSARETSPIAPAIVPAPVGAFTKWRADADQKKKVLENKKILVDATTTDEKDAKALMQVSAVGFIDVPFKDVKKWVKDYPDLKNVDERFREVSWNPSTKELFLHMEAYSYHAQMKLRVVETSTDDAFLMELGVHPGKFPRNERSCASRKGGKRCCAFP